MNEFSVYTPVSGQMKTELGAYCCVNGAIKEVTDILVGTGSGLKSLLIENLLPIGGVVFYDAGSNGVTYHWYDANKQEISSPDGAVYYKTDKVPTESRYYVYALTIVGDKMWGGYGTSIGTTSGDIGKGKTNSETALQKISIMENNSIWKQLQTWQNNALNGYTDWFIPSTYELQAAIFHAMEKKNDVIYQTIYQGEDYFTKPVWSSTQLSGSTTYQKRYAYVVSSDADGTRFNINDYEKNTDNGVFVFPVRTI